MCNLQGAAPRIGGANAVGGLQQFTENAEVFRCVINNQYGGLVCRHVLSLVARIMATWERLSPSAGNLATHKEVFTETFSTFGELPVFCCGRASALYDEARCVPMMR
jgi:hypothetical protein